MSLSPRLIAIQGIAYTPIALAVQGLVDFIAGGGTTRRPKSTNRMKLLRITDAQVFATGTRSLSRTARVAARGQQPPALFTVVAAGTAHATGVHAGTRVGRATMRANACAAGYGAATTSKGGTADGRGNARATGFGAAASTRTCAGWGRGSAIVSVRGCVALAHAGNAHARGTKNLSVAQLASVVAAVYSKR